MFTSHSLPLRKAAWTTLAMFPRQVVAPSSVRRASFRSNVAPLIAPHEARHLRDTLPRTTKFIDASWYLDTRRDPWQEFKKERIPGAIFFDVDAIADLSSGLPHMLPNEVEFNKAMTQLGISNNDTLIVYGGPNCSSAPRGWWTFKCFDHDNVHVLNGGIEAWKQAGNEMESSIPVLKKAIKPYSGKLNRSLIKNSKEVLEAIGLKGHTTLDARPSERFLGLQPEPREGLRMGHIPESINVPFAKLLETGDYSTFKSSEEIRKIFEEQGVNVKEDKVLITSCGSGVNACVLSLALHTLGLPLEQVPVYDGSWSEWGKDATLPIATSSKPW